MIVKMKFQKNMIMMKFVVRCKYKVMPRMVCKMKSKMICVPKVKTGVML